MENERYEVNVCIAIPLYKQISDEKEIISLKQGLKIFSNYPIIFFHPRNLDLSQIKNLCRDHEKISFEAFEDAAFKNVKTYSFLMLDEKFYERFLAFDFMLLYQLDAYVFADELELWCQKGFDYIGAPWFKNFKPKGETEFMPNAGNGGFSLRNIQAINRILKKKFSFPEMIEFRKILKKYRTKPFFKIVFNIGFFAKFLTKNNSFAELLKYIHSNASCPNEDYFIAQIFPEIFPEFKVAKAEEAIAFAFECRPEMLYEINGEKLPFGCHGWYKYSPEFWEKFIK